MLLEFGNNIVLSIAKWSRYQNPILDNSSQLLPVKIGVAPGREGYSSEVSGNRSRIIHTEYGS